MKSMQRTSSAMLAIGLPVAIPGSSPMVSSSGFQRLVIGKKRPIIVILLHLNR
jgi:hypothetical protein